MPQQTLAQSRVIDPILTTHAIGYARPGNIGQLLFPTATVGQYGGKVLTFGKESFRKYNTKRAPGSATQRITFGYDGDPYAIVPAALEALVPDENMTDAAAVPGIDLASDAVDLVLDVFELEHEVECATLARNAANYDSSHKTTLTGTDKWTAGGTADPTDDIMTAQEALRASIGVRGNLVVLSATAFAALQSVDKIIERLKYHSAASVTTDMLARLWNVPQVVVGEAVAAEGVDDTLGDVWGNDVIVAYVSPAAGGNRRSAARPSYGYTYTMKGHPNVKTPYRDENRNSWVYGVNCDRVPVISGITAGFLIKDAGAA